MHRLAYLAVIFLSCQLIAASCPFHRSGEGGDLENAVRIIREAGGLTESSSDPLAQMNQLLKQDYAATKQLMLQDYLNQWPLVLMVRTCHFLSSRDPLLPFSPLTHHGSDRMEEILSFGIMEQRALIP